MHQTALSEPGAPLVMRRRYAAAAELTELMAIAGPHAAFVQATGSERWKILIRDFRAFRERLGPDVVRAFCCCFVHADRLTSLISFGFLSQQHYGRDAIGFNRNLQTMVWFTVGTLRELASAIRDLRSALAKRGARQPDAPCWVKLREVEKRWEDDPFYRDMRNIVAFHVDPDVVEKGLAALEDRPEVTLCDGEGPKRDASSLILGWDALFMGLDKDLPEFEKFAATVGEDHGIESAVQEAFILALESADIPIEDERAA